LTYRKAQLVTLRAFLMLAVITVAIATFTAIVSVWSGALEDPPSNRPSLSRLQINCATAIVEMRRHPTNF
jgi:hypothetical protein